MLRRSGRKRRAPTRITTTSTNSTTPNSVSSATHPIISMPVMSSVNSSSSPVTVATTYTASATNYSHPISSAVASTMGNILPQYSPATGNVGVTFNADTFASTTPTPIQSISGDISVGVAQNIQEKIVKGEYVDLATLLVNTNQPDLTQRLALQNGELVLQKTQNSKILNIEQWTTAFTIFISIFCKVHLHRFQELLKYMHTIRLGASRSSSMGWKTYDEQFRLRKALDPNSSWGSVDTELWLIYMSNTQMQEIQHNPYSRVTSPNHFKSSLKCYNFNYKGYCSTLNCIYTHACLYCNSNHPLLKCQQKNYKEQGPRFQNPRNFNYGNSRPRQLNHSSFITNRQQRPRAP